MWEADRHETEREPEHDKDRPDRDEETANQDQRGKVHVLRRGRCLGIQEDSIGAAVLLLAVGWVFVWDWLKRRE